MPSTPSAERAPSNPVSASSAGAPGVRPGALRRAGDRLFYRAPDADGEVAVRAVWARPLSGRGGAVSLLSADKKMEVAWIPSLDRLDADSRALVTAELDAGVVLPRITRVWETEPRFGHRYWRVDTDMGPTDFLSRSPETNVVWLSATHCLIRDVLGNEYEIPDLSALDPASQVQAMRAL